MTVILILGRIMIKARRLTQREILFDLDQAVDACFAAEGKSAQFDRLSKTRSNLLRMWVET
jgi:PKHD-type hydroxylase